MNMEIPSSSLGSGSVAPARGPRVVQGLDTHKQKSAVTPPEDRINTSVAARWLARAYESLVSEDDVRVEKMTGREIVGHEPALREQDIGRVLRALIQG